MPGGSISSSFPYRRLSVPEMGPSFVEMRPEPHGGDACCQSATVVRLHRETGESARAGGRLQAHAGRLLQEAAHRLVLGHAEDRIVVAAHAGIRLEGGACRQDAVIRR